MLIPIPDLLDADGVAAIRALIDAADWVGPYNDLAFGLHQVADYYYTSAWNEPSAVLEGTVNLDAWNALPDDLKAVVNEAAKASNLAMISEFAFRNAEALDALVNEHGVKLRSLPDDRSSAPDSSSSYRLLSPSLLPPSSSLSSSSSYLRLC